MIVNRAARLAAKERERRTRLVLSFLRPFVLSGKRATRIDYVPDWRLDGAIMASLSLRELRFEMLVKYRRNRRPTRSGPFLSFLAMKSHSVDRKFFFLLSQRILYRVETTLLIRSELYSIT